jgi:hypothetical protein
VSRRSRGSCSRALALSPSWELFRKSLNEHNNVPISRGFTLKSRKFCDKRLEFNNEQGDIIIIVGLNSSELGDVLLFEIVTFSFVL